MIVKVQFALASNTDQPPALIYDRSRKFHDMVPVEELPETVVDKVRSKFNRKAYFHADRSPTGRWVFATEARDEAW